MGLKSSWHQQTPPRLAALIFRRSSGLGDTRSLKLFLFFFLAVCDQDYSIKFVKQETSLWPFCVAQFRLLKGGWNSSFFAIVVTELDQASNQEGRKKEGGGGLATQGVGGTCLFQGSPKPGRLLAFFEKEFLAVLSLVRNNKLNPLVCGIFLEACRSFFRSSVCFANARANKFLVKHGWRV